MALLDILKYPDPRLKEKCSPVDEITDEVRRMLDDMAETMYDAPGIGLAGSQVGFMHRIIVADVGYDDEDEKTSKLYKLINPRIVEKEGSVSSEEGCLSVPGIRETVKRFERVVVEALNEKGEEITIEADGLLSICLQHEIDHLDGVLFIDLLSQLKKRIVKSKLKKFSVEE